MRRVRADLHIHTSLSPCADEKMTPQAIVQRAMEQGLEMIAICDHNSAGNTAALQAATGPGLAVIAGMEITTAEEAHVAAWFPDAEAAMLAGHEVAASMPEHPRSRGCRPPIAASSLGLDEVVRLIHRHGGMAVAAHVDRPSFSVLSQLGLWPDDVAFDAAELSAAGMASGRAGLFERPGMPLVTSSDSHSLDEIGCVYTEFEMETPSFEGLKAALRRPLRREVNNA